MIDPVNYTSPNKVYFVFVYVMGKHELSTNHQTTSPLMIGKTTHCAGCLHNPLFPCSRLPLYHKTIHIAVSNQANECSSYFSSSLRSSTASDKSLQGGPALSIIVHPWPRLPENYIDVLL